MAELDDPQTFSRVVASLEEQLGVQGIKKIAAGNEFCILGATLPQGRVVIKVPKDRVFSNANDAHVESKDLLDQEFNLIRYMKSQGITRVPEPIQDIEAAGFGALVMSYVESDDSIPREAEMGTLLAQIHSLNPPKFALRAQEGQAMHELIAGRVSRRWQELSKFVPGLPAMPKQSELLKVLQPLGAVRKLLHMDFRHANLRTMGGNIVALLDWSNALIGHPALELARAAETGETGEDFLEAYKSVLPIEEISDAAEIILRLDTATMLALVFLSEEPNPERAKLSITRVHELHANLMKSQLI